MKADKLSHFIIVGFVVTCFCTVMAFLFIMLNQVLPTKLIKLLVFDFSLSSLISFTITGVALLVYLIKDSIKTSNENISR